MRFATKFLTTAAALVLVTATASRPADATPAPTGGIVATATAVSLTPVLHAVALTQEAKIDINVDTDRGGAWYTQPVWIAIGIIALVLIILLIVAAGRRDSTTVVK